LLAGCGGGSDNRTTPPPSLPRAVASELANTSDAVASSLAAGDSCRALTLARWLRRQTLAAVSDSRVPARLKHPLRRAVEGLAKRIHCSPPPTPTTSGSVSVEPDEHGKGKHKGHEKKAKHGKERD
jgi:hypothetical protein